MTNIDKSTLAVLTREIALTLARKQRLAFASDFHAFIEGRQLTLAGVTFETFPRGPNTKRSDGDVVAHAIVMALVAATNQGDIEDWFSSSDGKTGVRSIEYLSEIYDQLIEPEHLLIGTVDVTIICGEEPRMKKYIQRMRHNIAEKLKTSIDQIHMKVSSMDGRDEIARLEGIEARVLVSLWEGL
ncbi:MAG TPA: 2-C-methyl-D-erythritol 2,4-cyclodiphosphate synthase [Ktedonobacteraceae bacterium]|nr:2-C-methyl-D-erythritol 2,4-cyclodiphosphate synthase [Ktedonobacteraceae bacterium]